MKLKINNNYKVSLAYILFFAILFQGCKNEEKLQATNKFNIKGFKELILQSLNGNTKAIDSLSGLVDTDIPPPRDYNKILIDSAITFGGKKYYFALIENPNPVYNRLAFYDSTYALFLLDKSLNGYLNYRLIKQDTLRFLELIEDFISKDTIKLKRRSLYLLNNNSVNLSYRSFCYFSWNKIEVTQDLETINSELVNTKIISSGNFPLEKKWDTFTFNESEKYYRSEVNFFDSLVIKLIKSNLKKSKKPSIEDKISLLKSLGIFTAVDSINKYNNYQDKKNRFTINIPDGWRVLKDIVVSKKLNNNLIGTTFINASLGASFSIIKLMENQKAEDFINYTLSQTLKGNYIVRLSEKFEEQKMYYQFFEISCINLKYLIIFDCPVAAYKDNKQTFEDIINSFGIDC